MPAPALYHQPRKKGIHWSARLMLVLGVAGYYAQDYLFPHGFPVEIPTERRLQYAPLDKSNTLLQAKHGKLTKIVERVAEGQEPLLKGPETVILDNKGVVYAFARGAKLVQLDDFQQDPEQPSHVLTARASVAAHLGHGAAVSGKFTKDGKTLYITDPVLGLCRIRNFHDSPHRKLELIADKVVDKDGNMTRILFADDVVIGPKSGKIYFSDASDIPPGRIVPGPHWDLMYPSKLDAIRGKPTGRLLQYDPETEEVKVLAQNLWFANGVAVDKDETYVLFAETMLMRVSKYHLAGPNEGTLEAVLDSHQLTGNPDGVDCSWETSGPSAGKCYVAVPTAIVPAIKVLQPLPHPIDLGIRGLLMMLPQWLAPKVVDYGCVVEVDMETGATRYLQDPDATDTTFITGVTVHDNKLYLGTLHGDVVGIYDLN